MCIHYQATFSICDGRMICWYEKNKKEFMLQNTCFICGKCEKWKGRGVELTQMCKRAGSTSFMQAKDNRLLSVSLSCKIWSDNTLTIPPGLQRSEFENKEVTFEFHISREHNLWHYLYFIVHLNTKEKTELTGPESYVYQMISVSRLADHWPWVHDSELSKFVKVDQFSKIILISGYMKAC